MAVNEEIFSISLQDEMKDVYYFQQISHEKEKLVFQVPWGGAVIRNSSSSGEILQFRTVKDYEIFKREQNKSMWLLLPLKVFRNNNSLFGVYCCPQCEKMKGTEMLKIDQNPLEILARLCVHSKVCSTILGDWRDIWEITVSPQDQVVKIICNEDVATHTFQVRSPDNPDNTLLAAIRVKGDIALLYTVTSRQDTPICSICVTRKCPHATRYSEEEKPLDPHVEGDMEPVHEADENVVPTNLTTSSLPDEDVDDDESHDGTEEEIVQAGATENRRDQNYWVSTVLLCL